METYKVRWLDSYNTWNHVNDLDFENEKRSPCFSLSKEGLRNIKENYPVIDVEDWDVDGWVDCLHEITIHATDIEDLKKKVQEDIDNNGRIVEVFSVYDQNGKEILTEEDL
jgi:hypothetical protein